MKNVGSVMTVLRYAFPPDHNVLEAIKMVISEETYGCAIIIDEGKPVGIVTERDYIRKVIAKDLNPHQLKFSDIMTSPVITVPKNMGVIAAGKVMKEKGVKRLPVVEGDRPVGVVTSNEIAHAMVEDIDELSNLMRESVIDLEEYRKISQEYVAFEGFDSELLGQHIQLDDNCSILNPVSDIMTSKVHTVRKSTDAVDIAKRIDQDRVDCAVVTEKGVPIGTVSERTLLRRVIIDNHNPLKLTAKDIMLSPVITAKPETPIVTASRIMRKFGHGRLVITENGKMVGLVTEVNILETMFELAKDLHWRIIGRWHDGDFRQ